ncbi:MAG TPA: Fic family protein [bacterium]|nr:Fic family protein [bacterium]
MKGLLQTPLIPEVLTLVQKISRFKGEWSKSADTQREFYASLQKTIIITSAGASTRIEGAKLTDEEIIKRLSGLKIQNIRDRDEAEVAGYIDCKKYVFDHYGEIPVSEHSVRSLHQMMMAYMPEALFPLSQRGAYKNITNSVVRIDHDTGDQEIVFETTPPGPQTEAAMRELAGEFVAFIADPNYSDLEVIAAFIVEFLAIHPFRDGNGRISRLLTDLCLLRQGYDFCMYASHEKIIEDSKQQYYVALRQTQSTLKTKPDLNPWLLYFLRVLERQTQFLNDKLEPKKPGTLTKLEQQVFDLVRNHQPATFGFLLRETGIKKPTLKSILARLKERNVLAMEGERKGSRYRLR